jgi:ElaB/YqjD/DUF883 family membrane-anchored ribosome-binding protein
MQRHDTNTVSPDAIAAQLEQDRADLATSIDGLKDRLSLGAVLDDAIELTVSHAAPYGRALDTAVRSNPVAALMVGAGLAWLIFGRKSHNTNTGHVEGTKFEALSRWEDEGGPVAPLPDVEEDWVVESDRLRDRATAALSRIDDDAREKVRPLAESALERTTVLADLAKATRSAMGRGLEGLASEARDRVLAAREKAYAARIATVRQGAKLIDDQPITAGAVGMAIGAAIGSFLPQTKIENKVFGEERDRLLSQAQSVLQQELQRVARA